MQYTVNLHIAYPAVVTGSTACNFRRMKIRLAEFRDRLGLTLEQMAERIEASDSQLSRWEKGKSNIPSSRLPELARAYECRLSEIFVDDDYADEDLELGPDQLTDMLRLAQNEMVAGTSFADWPRAVATNLHEQLRQIQAAGGLRLSSGQVTQTGKADRSRRSSIGAAQEG
ncbi:helix-turn-helix transcriptional regulator [Sphingobium sufflavum]|uniref:helix-turn-helix transcriptional regulator n=1 Tax=Sphingobium sufflavum TaxID=1129547 RepID=UPI001F26B38A|nr:helix-turn-helix transcriptional regulator [Sphingobium sufflavum]MCE7797876.1 helix-turn-helix transcriptional regulator [Sphingobium sufflavum]